MTGGGGFVCALPDAIKQIQPASKNVRMNLADATDVPGLIPVILLKSQPFPIIAVLFIEPCAQKSSLIAHIKGAHFTCKPRHLDAKVEKGWEWGIFSWLWWQTDLCIWFLRCSGFCLLSGPCRKCGSIPHCLAFPSFIPSRVPGGFES